MKKVLFTATVDSHILQFHLPFLKLFKDNGYEVHVATNGDEEIPYCDIKHKISFERSPLKINNLKAIKQLKRICDEEKFDIIHTHTPMGSVVTRLAAKQSRKKYGTRVIYTAHGFHFFKGAPVKNWLIFYPVEKWLAKYTDTLILINQEDYKLAKKKFSRRCSDIQYVPGVGIDENKFNFKFTDKEKENLRKSIGINKDDFVMIFVARMDVNKNQNMLIDCVEKISKSYNKLKLLLVGPDERNGYYQNLVKTKNLNDFVLFLGYRNDIPQLMCISDLALSSSKREGLPVNVIEAFASSLPVIAYNCRGMNDLISNDINGYIVNNTEEMILKIKYLINNKSKCLLIGKNNKEESKKYLLNNITAQMEKIYNNKIKIANKNLIYYVKDIKKNLQLKINKMGSKKRKNKIKNQNVTIIANNCFAGITYEYLSLPFNSPTIGLYFFAPEYIKFIKKLKFYTSLELRPLDFSKSKYCKELEKLNQKNVILGKLDDVEIVFLHYNSFEEAKQKWERRCKRINYNNIVFKFNDQNLCTQKELKEFNEFNSRNKICFTSKKYNYDGFIQMKKYSNCDYVKEDAFYYHRYLDIIDYINSMHRK